MPGLTAEPESSRYSIAAVDRALDLLEALARIGPAPLADIAKEANCTRTAGFRLLRTMEARGFAIQDKARGSWRLGARWGVLGRAASAQGALAAVAGPFLTALGESCGETVYLRVRDGVESETVAAYRPDPALRLYTDVGKRRPLHAGCGRILLAYAPESVRKQVLSQRLPRFTPATRTDPDWLIADMQRIRARGWLLTADEVEAGAVSIAAPVRDGSGLVVAVLFIAAPALRMRPHRARSLLPAVLDAAGRLSAALGAEAPGETEAPPTASTPGVSGAGLLARQAG
ncbi:MAG: IclR family transcriptional regulator [Alphaproteobacteria bacterium]|nr:IclR family transcriptional regulator [Alphaproteobacteria bacterium]